MRENLRHGGAFEGSVCIITWGMPRTSVSDTGADEGGAGIPVTSDAGTSARAAEVPVGGSAKVMSTGARMPMSLESNKRADEGGTEYQ